MSSDSFHIGFLGIKFGFSKTDSKLILSEGETVILRYWNWRKFGYQRKAYTLKNGKISVQRLN